MTKYQDGSVVVLVDLVVLGSTDNWSVRFKPERGDGLGGPPFETDVPQPGEGWCCSDGIW